MSSAKRERKRARAQLGGVERNPGFQLQSARRRRARWKAEEEAARRRAALGEMSSFLNVRGLSSGVIGDVGRGLVRPLSAMSASDTPSEAMAAFNGVLESLRAGGSS